MNKLILVAVAGAAVAGFVFRNEIKAKVQEVSEALVEKIEGDEGKYLATLKEKLAEARSLQD